MADEDNGAEVLRLAVTIVSAHVSNNPVAAADLPALITTVHEALVNPAGTPKPSTPAVPIKKSVTPNYLICLDDGKKLKMLKRHLRTVYNMSPDEYRAKWGLKDDYPMTAPAYAKQRSALAKKIGLGRKTTRRKAKGKR
jgi:predicted transcriptional regulator